MSQIPALARRLPAGFLFGTATAAYQIEGGHDADGKGPSIWDTFCLRPGAISTGETGEIACDHYHRWREDVALMHELGLGAYRLSISWPRVLPSGAGAPNEKGLAFYDRLIDELLAAGIRPFVTLYHWDLPQALQDKGGWGSRAIVDHFGAYADLVTRRLGDRVTDWMTLNEPDAIRAASTKARVGIALNLSPCEPATDSAEDAAAATRADGYLNRWFLDPLHGRGYPKDMVALYAPYFDRARELDGYHGRLDFLGVNYYTRRLAKAGDGPLQLDRVEREGAERTALGWEVHPSSFHKILTRVHRDYAPREMFVTENGAAYDDVIDDDRVDDPARISFLSRHFAAAADAVRDGVPLRGYFIWTLMDNFEWAHGTSKRFGIVHTEYRTQRRRIKSSGRWYRDLIAAQHAAHVAAAAT